MKILKLKNIIPEVKNSITRKNKTGDNRRVTEIEDRQKLCSLKNKEKRLKQGLGRTEPEEQVGQC